MDRPEYGYGLLGRSPNDTMTFVLVDEGGRAYLAKQDLEMLVERLDRIETLLARLVGVDATGPT